MVTIICYGMRSSSICCFLDKHYAAINSNVCLRVLFTGLKVHDKELELAFHDYVEVYDRTDITSKSRMIPFIALYSCANVIHSWQFMNVITHKRLCRSQYKRLCRSQWIHIKTMHIHYIIVSWNVNQDLS